MSIDPYSGHADLTEDVGASVTIYSHSKYAVALSMGGDLTVYIGGITPARAREFARMLNEAAAIAEKEELPPWLKEKAA